MLRRLITEARAGRQHKGYPSTSADHGLLWLPNVKFSCAAPIEARSAAEGPPKITRRLLQRQLGVFAREKGAVARPQVGEYGTKAADEVHPAMNGRGKPHRVHAPSIGVGRQDLSELSLPCFP